MDCDVSLAIVVEVRVDEADFVGGANHLFFIEIHEERIQADGFSEVAQIESHVSSDRGGVESSLGADCAISLFEQGGVMGGNTQHAS